jgi:hypothetical protein
MLSVLVLPLLAASGFEVLAYCEAKPVSAMPRGSSGRVVV